MGKVHFVIRSLEQPGVPTRVFKSQIWWIQPTPILSEPVAPAPIIEIPSSKNDLEKDKTLAFDSKSVVEPIVELVSAPTMGPTGEKGFRWWKESDNSSHN